MTAYTSGTSTRKITTSPKWLVEKAKPEVHRFRGLPVDPRERELWCAAQLAEKRLHLRAGIASIERHRTDRGVSTQSFTLRSVPPLQLDHDLTGGPAMGEIVERLHGVVESKRWVHRG